MADEIAKSAGNELHGSHGAVESLILQLGSEIWQNMQGEKPGLFNREFWQGRIMEWAMKDASFRVDLFRFVDVLPVLKSRKQVYAHLKDYLIREDRGLPSVLEAALKAASGGLTGLVAIEVIKRNLMGMAQNFIVGETPNAALAALRALHHEGMGFTADLLGEATLTAEEAERYYARYQDLIESLAHETRTWKADPLLTHNHLGEIPLANVSIKLSALEARMDPVDTTGAVARLKSRLLPLFRLARERGIFLNLDMESWQTHGIAFEVFESLALDPSLKDWPHLGIVVQAYLHEATADIERLLSLAKKRGTPLTVRLVKGAYWDYETALAQQKGYPCPVLQGKEAVDAQYERLTRRLLDEIAFLLPAFGSHNLRSLVHALAYAERQGIPRHAYEIQMLYGMAEPERKALRAKGYRVRVYAPIGALLPGMAYLVRRLLENTSNTGFLRQTYHDGIKIEDLLQSPQVTQTLNPTSIPQPLSSTTADLKKFHFTNAPLTDFSLASPRNTLVTAVQEKEAQFPLTIPTVVGGRILPLLAVENWNSPNNPSLLIARCAQATAEDADQALSTAFNATVTFSRLPLEERTRLLHQLGGVLSRKRIELVALQVHEVGKPLSEADADVAEAIDFCHYYAERALFELSTERMNSPAGEDNLMGWQGRGPCAVIAPWNFPLAILTGMTAAALVAGNPVLIKPAEQSSATGYALYQACIEAGFSPDVVHFLPGKGEEIGAALVAHPKTALIAFTGSFAVGTQILARAAQFSPDQKQLKRVICELGGKNAIVIDEDADLDEAVTGVIRSAFGYAGQKCSAASRLFVVGDIYHDFIQRLMGVMRLLKVSSATEVACDIPPVIDDASALRLRTVFQNPGPGATQLFPEPSPASLTPIPSNPRAVLPALFEVNSPHHRLMQEEFFGPLLAVMHTSSFEQALEYTAATPYALTGGIYSRSPSHISKARAAFRVGNLYVNRPCTGAVVGRQPFGGYGHSGLGSKAGGPGYLRLFADPYAISENTLRHGFAPEISV